MVGGRWVGGDAWVSCVGGGGGGGKGGWRGGLTECDIPTMIEGVQNGIFASEPVWQGGFERETDLILHELLPRILSRAAIMLVSSRRLLADNRISGTLPKSFSMLTQLPEMCADAMPTQHWRE